MEKLHVSNLKYNKGYYGIMEYRDGSYSDIFCYNGVIEGRIECFRLAPWGSTRRGTVVPKSSKKMLVPINSGKLLIGSIVFDKSSRIEGNSIFDNGVFKCIEYVMSNILNAIYDYDYNSDCMGVMLKVSDSVDKISVSYTKENLDVNGFVDGKGFRVLISLKSKGTDVVKFILMFTKDYVNSYGDTIYSVECSMDGFGRILLTEKQKLYIIDSTVKVKNIFDYTDSLEYSCRVKYNVFEAYSKNILLIRNCKSYVIGGFDKSDFVEYMKEYGYCYDFCDIDNEKDMVLVDHEMLKPYMSVKYVSTFLNDCPRCVYDKCYKFKSVPNAAMIVRRDDGYYPLMYRIRVIKGVDGSALYYELCEYTVDLEKRDWALSKVVYADGSKKDIIDTLNSLCDGRMIDFPKYSIGGAIHIGNKDLYIKSIEDGTNTFKVNYEVDGLAIDYCSVLGKVDSSLDMNYDNPIGFGDFEINSLREILISRHESLKSVHNGLYRVFKFVNGNVVINKDYEVYSNSLFSRVVDTLPRLTDSSYLIVRNEKEEIVEKFIYNKDYISDKNIGGIKKVYA